MYTVIISTEEKLCYKELEKVSGITMQDVVFLACKHASIDPRFKGFKDYKELSNYCGSDSLALKKIFDTENTNFSKTFNRIRTVFGIDKSFFKRSGKYNSYAFTYREAIFVRALFIRIQERKIWNKIIALDNRNQLGFVRLYNETCQNVDFFEELTFFIDSILDIAKKERKASKEYLYLEKHLFAITKYPYIKILQLTNRIILLSADKLISCDTKKNAIYEHYLAKLYLGIENEISKANILLKSEIIESILLDKSFYDTSELIEKNKVLDKLVEIMKSINADLYGTLTKETFYNHFLKLENTADTIVEKIQAQTDVQYMQNNYQNNQTYIHHIIRLDLQKALDKLPQADFDLLAEDAIKEFYLNI